MRFTIQPGNAAESPTLPSLLEGLIVGEVIAYKADDTNIIRNALAEQGVVATIPPRRSTGPNRPRFQYPYDKDSYRTRHLVENLFADLKRFRGLATRYCKKAERYQSFVSLAGRLPRDAAPLGAGRAAVQREEGATMQKTRLGAGGSSGL